MSKSILNLGIVELQEVIKTGELPEGVNLSGIEEHKDFAKLFRFRATPSRIAEHLLKEQMPELKGGKRGGSYEPPEMKEKRLSLKEKELQIKQLKAETQTHLLKTIIKKLDEMDKKISFILKNLS